MDANKLTAALGKLDRALTKRAPKAALSLRPGASAAELAALRAMLPDGAPLEELEAWFRWHDGQSSVVSLSPADNRTMLSVAECVEAMTFWRDTGQSDQPPWPPTWVPLLSNGAGDFVVYEVGSDGPGELFGFWHDEPDYWSGKRSRWRERKSLSAWAAAVCKELASAPERNIELVVQGEWQRVTSAPTEAELQERPIGTAFLIRQFDCFQAHLNRRVFVKVSADRWSNGCDREDEDVAMKRAADDITPDGGSWSGLVSRTLANEPKYVTNVPAHLKLVPPPKDQIGLFESSVSGLGTE